MIAGVDDLAAAEAAVPVLERRSWVHAFHRPRALWFSLNGCGDLAPAG